MRLIDKEVFGLDEADISGEHVAGCQLHDITGNDVFHIHFHDATVPDDIDLIADHLLKFLRRGIRFFRLYEGDDRRDRDNKHQHQERRPARLIRENNIRDQGHDRNDKKNHIERIDDRISDTHRQSVTASGIDDISAVFLEAVTRLYLIQAFFRS